MKYNLITLLIVLYSSTVFAAEYRINEFVEKYDYDKYFLELSLKEEAGEGNNIPDIIELVYFYKDNFSIRILGLPLETRKELNNYYKKTNPEKLNIALKSAGNYNLHSPTLQPLKKDFNNAFKSTKLFKEIEATLKNKNYSISKISFEKFSIGKGIIHIADIWIKAEKSYNP